MKELIPVSGRSIAGAIVQTVNARDLHGFLGSRQDFSTWIKGRIEQYGFIDGQDFTVHKFVDRRGNVVDYHLSLDMAKELSMVERTAKGKKARQYFIDCERRANERVDPMAALSDPTQLRSLLLGYSEKVIVLEAKVKEQEPKVAALDRLKNGDTLMCVRDAAKVLGIHERKELVPWLVNNWCYRHGLSNRLMGKATARSAGYVDHKCLTVHGSNGDREEANLRITAKGLAKLADVFAKSPSQASMFA